MNFPIACAQRHYFAAQAELLFALACWFGGDLLCLRGCVSGLGVFSLRCFGGGAFKAAFLTCEWCPLNCHSWTPRTTMI